MKLLFITFCCLVALVGASSSAFGQSGGHRASPMKASSNVFSCEKCHVASMKSGKCPGCKAEMVGIQAKVKFVCAECHTSSTKMGSCAKCGKAMAKSAITYACDHCHLTSKAPGKCAKCGMGMKKHVMKVVG